MPTLWGVGLQQTLASCTPGAESPCSPSCTLILHPKMRLLTHGWPDSMKCGSGGRACPSPWAVCRHCGDGWLQQTLASCTPGAESPCSPSCTLLLYHTLHMLTSSWPDSMKCGADGRACPSPGAGCPHCGDGGLQDTLASCTPGDESPCSPSCTLILYPTMRLLIHSWPDSMNCGADGRACPSPGAGCRHCGEGGCSRHWPHAPQGPSPPSVPLAPCYYTLMFIDDP
jgi:hypothetical protein